MFNRSYYDLGKSTKNSKIHRYSNQLVKSIVDLATGEAEEIDSNDDKDPNTVALG